MQMKRLRIVLTVIALGCAATGAWALGFGPAPMSATLGQPLDYSVGLRLDAGEAIDAHCVHADVVVGEQRLPAAAVSARIEGEGAAARVRVLTSASIDEPIVSVAIAVGCPQRLSRRFVLLADPLPAATVSAPFAVPAASAALPLPASAAIDPRAPAARPMGEAAAITPARTAPRVSRPTQASRPAAARRTAAPAEATAAAANRSASTRRPRLQLDAPEPSSQAPGRSTAELIEAAASAAAAAAAAEAQASAEAASAASAAAARIAALEQSIAKLQADALVDRESILLLRQRAAQGDSAARWMPWLLALMLALGLLAAWQALKLRRLQSERQQLWSRAVADGAGAAAGARTTLAPPMLDATTTMAPPSSGGYSSTRPPTMSPVFAPDPVPANLVESTEVLPLGGREIQGEAPRDVSIEELIDLEQQAEFFIVLGQDDAAVDLLVDYLRSTGGGSPMPYLKLLEIYRRRGDREAYERTRARFNHRFNAYAPDWDSGDVDGRLLEDYPAIVGRLQQAWGSPIDAMAELESLLFRKSRGELFDMPAYRDVLFLYAMARDLMDREPVDTGTVDVLLPISDAVDYTQPMSLDEAPGAPGSGVAPLDNMPTMPVDLDVTQPAMPDSLFGDSTLPLGDVRHRI